MSVWDNQELPFIFKEQFVIMKLEYLFHTNEQNKKDRVFTCHD